MRLQRTIHLLGPLALAATTAAHAQSPAPTNEARAAAAVSSLRDTLTEPLVQRFDDSVFVRMRDQRATFEGDTLTILPVFGTASPREWPIEVTVAGATVDGSPLDVTTAEAIAADSRRVRVSRGQMRGVHHLNLDGLEQTFVFDELTVRGELVLQLDVATDLAPIVDGDSLRFGAGALGHVEVGAAFVFDAAGRRQRIAREWTGSGIDLLVPADFVRDATLPLTIDPVWTTFVNSGPVHDDAHPDVAFCGASQEYVLVWEDQTSQSSSDVYAMKLDVDLQPSSSVVAVGPGLDSWTDPAVTYIRSTDEAVIVATVENGTSDGRIVARPIDVTPWTPNAAFTVSSTGFTDKQSPDVGGHSSPVQNAIPRFCVVWSREASPGNYNVEYRVMRTDGTAQNDITTVSLTGGDEIHPCVSMGLGNTYESGLYWNMAWTKDTDDDGLGKIQGRRVNLLGDPQDGVPYFDITVSTDCAHPSISSTFDDFYFFGRPVLCAYERHLNDLTRPNGLQSDIEIRTMIEDTPVLGSSMTVQEDGPRGLLQVRPRISINGSAFMLTYVEEEPTALNQGRWNAYMCSGEVRPVTLGLGVPLAERHVPLGTTMDLVSEVAIATRWSGDVLTSSNEAFAVWSRYNGNQSIEHGQIEGAGVDYLIPSFLTAHAVGEQYGTANENSTGTTGWLRILGDQDPTMPHLAQAIDLPQNAFGYLVVGTSQTNVNMPGGSSGRLLVGGNVGRYVNSIQSSGLLGRIDVAIDPTSIPQANGAVSALADQTFYFQMWHRDSSGGQATSNFTNGCRLYFQ